MGVASSAKKQKRLSVSDSLPLPSKSKAEPRVQQVPPPRTVSTPLSPPAPPPPSQDYVGKIKKRAPRLGKSKSTFKITKQPSLLNGIVGRFDVGRGGATDDGAYPHDKKEYSMPTEQLYDFPKKIKSKSSHEKLEEIHFRLDCEHALLRAIAKDDHAAISGLRERFPNYEVNWGKQVGNFLGNTTNTDVFYYRVAEYGLEWNLGDTAAQLAKRNKKMRAFDAIVAASTDTKLLHDMFTGSWQHGRQTIRFRAVDGRLTCRNGSSGQQLRCEPSRKQSGHFSVTWPNRSTSTFAVVPRSRDKTKAEAEAHGSARGSYLLEEPQGIHIVGRWRKERGKELIEFTLVDGELQCRGFGLKQAIHAKLNCEMDSASSTVKIWRDDFEVTFQYLNHPPGAKAKAKRKKMRRSKKQPVDFLLELSGDAGLRWIRVDKKSKKKLFRFRWTPTSEPQTSSATPTEKNADDASVDDADSRAQRKWSKVVNGGGAVAWQRAKFFLVGQGRAGKTSLLRSLRNLPFKETRSTTGVDTCDIHATNLHNWKTVHESEYAKAVARLVAAMQAAEHALAEALEAHKTSGDTSALLQAVHEAERCQLDDDSDVLIEARLKLAGLQASTYPEPPVVRSNCSENVSEPSENAIDDDVKARDTEEAPVLSDDLDEAHENDVEVEDISLEEAPAPGVSDGTSPDVVAAAKKKFKEAKTELVLRFSDSQTNHVTFNVWDCGGQPVFDAMHSVFMSAATQNLSGNDDVNTSYTGALAVFAVVFSICDLASPSPQTQQRCLHFLFYWLNQIAVQAPGAPVMLIGTHKDAASRRDIALSHKLLRRHIKQMYMYKHLNIVKPEKVGGTTPWCYEVDNTAREMRDGQLVASDPAVSDIRAKLEEVVRNDERVVEGLDGKPTRYVDFRMPLQCLLLLETLKDKHGRVCSRTDVTNAARALSIDPEGVPLLLRVFSALGALNCFAHVDGAADLVILEPQWLVDSMACVIREHGGYHGDLLEDLLDDDDADGLYRDEDILQGRLSVSLMEYIWKSDKECYKSLRAKPEEITALKQILLWYGLVCEVRHDVDGNDENFFVVPTLLPDPEDIEMHFSRLQSVLNSNTASKEQFFFDFSKSKFLPQHLFERVVCTLVTHADNAGRAIQVDDIGMAKGVSDIRAGDVLFVMQLTGWRIAVTTANTQECPHASHTTLDMVQNAMKAVMQTDHYHASHTVVLRHEHCEVDVEALRRAVTQGRSTVDSMPDARRRRSAISTTALSEKWLVPPSPSTVRALALSSVSDSGASATVLPTVPRLTKVLSTPFTPAPKSQSTFPSNPASLVAFLNKHFGDAFFESVGRTLHRSEDGTVLIVTAFHNVFKEVTVKCCINYDNQLRKRRKRAVELHSSYPCEDSICQLLQFVVVNQPSMHFMVLEYMAQGTLRDAIATATDSAGCIDQIQAIDAAIGVLAALVPLHRDGIVHCGVYPSRVGVAAGNYKLLGFGTCYRECKMSICRADNSTRSTRDVSKDGSWAYWSPEQCQKEGLISAQTDLWAVGVLLYHCISGRLPFESQEAILGPDAAPCLIHHPHANATGAAVIPSLAKIVCTALKKSGGRFKSATRMLIALEEVRRELVASRQRTVERKHQHKIGAANLQQFLSQAAVDGLSALSDDWRRCILPQDSVEGERVAKMLSIEQQTLFCGCEVNTNRFRECVDGAAKKFFQSRIALYSQYYVAERAQTQVSALLKSLDQMFVASYNNIFDTQIRVGEGAEALQKWEKWATAKIQHLKQSPPIGEFKQFTNDVVECMVHATTVRAQYKSAFQSVATATGTTFTMAPMKKLFRVLEKCAFREECTDRAQLLQCDVVYDIVRGAIVCPSMDKILEVAKAICDRSDFVVCRLKDRFRHPTSAMWRDVVINGFFEDGARHMVEVQLHHNSMLFVRGNLGGHYIYARFRALMEAVDTAKAEWAKTNAKDESTTSTTAPSSSGPSGPQHPPGIDIDGNGDDHDSLQEVDTTPQPPLVEREQSPASPSPDPFLVLVERVRVNLRLPRMPPLDIIEAGAEEVGLESCSGNWAEMANALAEELGIDLRC